MKIQLRLFGLFVLLFLLTVPYLPYDYAYAVKLIPMFLLASFAFTEGRDGPERVFFIGLLFSMGGDFFLEYDRDRLFIYGLGSFFIAHVFYLLAMFSNFRFRDLPIRLHRVKIVIMFLLVVYGITIMWLISPGLGDMAIPVYAYFFILLLMGLTTFISGRSNLYLIVGGLLFVLSDSFIGLNRFHSPLPLQKYLIMGTYYSAQWFLTYGFFRNSPENRQDVD